MTQEIKQVVKGVKKISAKPTVSTTLSDGSLVEMLYRPEGQETLFCIWSDGKCRYESALLVSGQRLVPYSPHNNLIRNDVVLFPSGPEEYGSDNEIIGEIQSFIHRYVDVTPTFEKLASYYVLFSWVYDGFNELPYLRVRGDYGSGKTRFLLIL